MLASLGWYITGDGDAGLDMEFDPKLAHLMRYSGLKSPESQTTASIVTEYSNDAVAFSSVAPKAAVPVELVDSVVVGRAQTAYHSLVHGSVMGVPIDGTASGSDDRPDAGTISGSMGLDLDDIAAALAAPGLGLDQANRHTAEQLAAAFTGDLLSRIGTADGLSDLEEREHSDGFWGLPGTPVPGAKPDRLRAEDTTPMGPTKVGRKGRADQYAAGFDALTTQVSWRTGVLPMTTRGTAKGDSSIHKARDDEQLPHKAGGADAPASRSVTRAAPPVLPPSAGHGGVARHPSEHAAPRRRPLRLARAALPVSRRSQGLVPRHAVGRHDLADIGQRCHPGRDGPRGARGHRLRRVLVALAGRCRDATWRGLRPVCRAHRG